VAGVRSWRMIPRTAGRATTPASSRRSARVGSVKRSPRCHFG